MACRDAYKVKTVNMAGERIPMVAITTKVSENVHRLLFGVDSKTQANNRLQNNLEQFEWVVRNKIYPNFYGRYLVGENALTREEILYIHTKGCMIAPIYADESEKQSEEQGRMLAKKIDVLALELGIPVGTGIYLELNEKEEVSHEFMLSFAKSLMMAGYTPGFKANTDAKFTFDREFSRGMQTNREVFEQCLIWAVAPTVSDYDRMTTTHLIHPDNWVPFAPSGITRKEIAIWQYGKDCHPIHDDSDRETSFNLNLIRNEQIIMEKMF